MSANPNLTNTMVNDNNNVNKSNEDDNHEDGKNSTIYKQTFKIQQINPDGKSFANVSRVVMSDLSSKDQDKIQVDIHTMIFPLAVNESLEIVIATTDILKDEYEYVMH